MGKLEQIYHALTKGLSSNEIESFSDIFVQLRRIVTKNPDHYTIESLQAVWLYLRYLYMRATPEEVILLKQYRDQVVERLEMELCNPYIVVDTESECFVEYARTVADEILRMIKKTN